MKCSVKDLKVLYLDNHLLALSKPAGLLTQPSDSIALNLEDVAKEWIKEKFHKKGNVFLHPIHRLDKPVSGIVLFARTSKALSRLNEQMRRRIIKKTYHAKVEGHLEVAKATLKHTLEHASHRARVSPQGKEAILSYTTCQVLPNATLVEIELHTGRYHQIRAQFSHIGHPIVGDTKYGSTQKAPFLALHHSKMVIEHPVLKTQLIITDNSLFN